MQTQTGIQRAVEMFDNSPTKLAHAIGSGVLRQHVEHWLKAGRVSSGKCPEVAAATGIPCEDLNDEVSWALVRNPPDPSKAADPVAVISDGVVARSVEGN